jgi:hypothetical protein
MWKEAVVAYCPDICFKAITELTKEELVKIVDALAENRIPEYKTRLPLQPT